MASDVLSSPTIGGISLGTTQQDRCNIEALQDEWPDSQEKIYTQYEKFFEDVLFCTLLSYGQDYDRMIQMDARKIREALRESLKSLTEDEQNNLNNVALISPFPDPKCVTSNSAINYYLALDGSTDAEFVENGVGDLLRWAWECLPTASNNGDPETLFYLGLIIARSLFSVRKHNRFGPLCDKVKPLDPSMPLDANHLTKWKDVIEPHLMSHKTTIFEEFEYPLPHLSVFAWVCWEYLDYFRSSLLPPTLLRWLLSALDNLRLQKFVSLPQSDHHAANTILDVTEKQCLAFLSRTKPARAKEAEFDSSQPNSSSLPALPNAANLPLAAIITTVKQFLVREKLVSLFGLHADRVIHSALDLIAVVFILLNPSNSSTVIDHDLESVKRSRPEILALCLELVSEFVPRLSENMVATVLSSVFTCIYRIRKNSDEEWCTKFNNSIASPSSSFFADLASALIPRSHRFIHRVLVNSALKAAARLTSGPKQADRIFNLFMESGLMLLLRCHAILSQFHLGWLDYKTKQEVNAIFHDDANKNRPEGYRFQTQHTEKIFESLESAKDGVIDCSQYLPHHFTAFGAKVLSSTLDIVLPFNQGHVSANYLASFLGRVLSQPYAGPSLDTTYLSPTEMEHTSKIEMTSVDGPAITTMYPPEEVWIESQSTDAISSLPPNHALSWDQAFMLLQYIGVTSQCAKELIRGLPTDSIQKASHTLDGLTAIVCERLVSLAEKKIPFSTFLRPTFCEWLQKTHPGPEIPDWYGDDVSFILLWQEFSTDRLCLECNSLTSAFVDAHLSQSRVLKWMLLPSCLLPYPDISEVLFSINSIHRLAHWSHEHKNYFVRFDPGFDSPSLSSFYRSNPTKQYWSCRKQHGMPEAITSPTIEELGKELRRVLNVEGDEAFQETNLLLDNGDRVAKYFVSAVLLRVDELIFDLPGVENFYYQVEKQKWCVEVKDLKTLSDDHRFDTVDIVKWTPRHLTPRHLMLKQEISVPSQILC